ncbi:unnamed protein product [Tuber melanosporum]|uniref:(Perigord truffle) hypothetical protein n=1 Tax=Tuber melanosporum (strain Mel28) TaxID=656061 RepID=D5GBA7_TUBMM|nr:uncharacterized protein GSTUM_00000393001 [Tuber melanosporum]CAZ81800.1 unnamed protein product [Tuber melanosporum]
MDPSAPDPPLEPPSSPKSTEYALSSAEVKQEPVACIFCLNDLLRGAPSAGVDEDVARLNPCNHTMHNECLQLWLERANSCPLCRTNFHEVSVSKTLDSEVTRAYNVEDKIQVADDIQPHFIRPVLDLALLHAAREHDAAAGHFETFHAQCSHCYLDDRGETVLCPLCARFYHVDCLEPRRPANVLICRRCALRERRAVMNNGNSFEDNPLRTGSLSRFQRARLVAREQLAWESAWERLEAEHSPWDDDEDDDDDTENQIVSILTRTNRRRAVAAAQTGGLSTFVEPVAWTEPVRRTRTAWPQEPKVITEEEKELWDTFELALKESQGRGTHGDRSPQDDPCTEPSKKRDGESSSGPGRSSEEQREEEVRRKRPRTRRDSQLLVNTGDGPILKSHTAHTTPVAMFPNIRQPPASEGPESSPSAYSQVMSYIGKGLEYSPPGAAALVGGVGPGAVPPDFSAAPSPGRRLASPEIATSLSPFVVGSPPMSCPGSPIAEAPIRRSSGKVSSPTRRTPASPTQPIFSRPWERPPRPASSSHKRPYQAPSPPSGSDSSGNEDQQNSRKRRSINCLTPEAKQDLASVVTSILQPMYPTMISKQEFTEINKKVSRQLYSIFNNENFGLDDKERWKKVAQEHVSIALKHLSV